MITTLKSRRSGEDLRDHPAVTAFDSNKTMRPPPVQASELVMGDRVLRIESVKLGKYDRGTKKVFVDGTHWGFVKTSMHGVWGATYTLHDLHGEVGYREKSHLRGKIDRWVAVTAKPDSKRHIRSENIGKPASERTKPRSNSIIMLDMIAKAIDAGHFRSPSVRREEIRKSADDLRQSIKAHSEANDKKLDDKAREVLGRLQWIPEGQEHPQTDVDLIVDAMKWAQTK